MRTFKQVFIVDDDNIYTYLFCKMLRANNFDHDIRIFQDGKEALNTLKLKLEINEELPVLIFLDINMPELNGWEFFRISKRHQIIEK